MRALLRAVVLIVGWLSAGVFAGEPESFRISLDRPSRQGEKGAVEVVYAHVARTTTTWDGYEPQSVEEAVAVHFIADVAVQKVNTHGHPVEIEFTIRKCTQTREEKETELFSPGSKLLARAKGRQTVFKIEGSDVSDETESLLNLFITLGRSDAVPSYDKLWATDAPHKIGERWEIHSPVAADDLKSWGIEVDPKSIIGHVTFKGREDVDQEPCLKVEADLQIKHMKPAAQADVGHTFEDGTMKGRYSWVAPIDFNKELHSWVSELTYTYKWTGTQNGLDYQMVQTIQSERHGRVLRQ